MKLYRHHSDNFQKEIEKAGNNFVTDRNRDFNLNNKNQARFFFYCPTAEDASLYENDNEEFGYLTNLHTYEVDDDVKLLDLRKVEDRRKLTKLVNELVKKDNESRLSSIDLLTNPRWQFEKRKKAAQKQVDELVKSIKSVTTNFEGVVTDDKNNRHNGSTFWGQNIVDYEMGKILKDEIISLGYDGVIFKEYRAVEIALLKPAKELK